jgi:hypothetical protein
MRRTSKRSHMREIGQNKGFHISLPEDEREWEFGQE